MASAMPMDPAAYPESPVGEDDVIYPCKGCGEILEEGKAFELAGNRWHIQCFRCNTCGTHLDSDANLLLLGDGSLICNNCTYSCNACGNKIEDLAILTGDQAFCASCFRCRNCKRKIENLRYARTSQGIFCMSCHESLMARRRKKGKTSSRQAQGGANGDKALPSLPPGASNALSSELELTPSEGYSESIGPLSPGDSLRTRTEASPNPQRTASPLSDEAFRGGYTMRSVAETRHHSSHSDHTEGPTLPASTYGERKASNVSEISEDGNERGFLPMAFDPTPVAPKSQAAIPRKQLPQASDSPTLAQTEARLPRDYFGRSSAKPPIRDVLREDRQASSSRSVSTEREIQRNAQQPKTSPHILFQEKGRPSKTSSTNSPAAGSPSISGYPERSSERPKPQKLDTRSLNTNDDFKLGDVPKEKKNVSRTNSKSEQSPILPIPGNLLTKQDRNERNASPMSLDSPNPFDDPRRKENPPTSGSHPPPRNADRPARGDSLAPAPLKPQSSSTPESSTPTTASSQVTSSHKRQDSTSSFPASLNEAAQNGSAWPTGRTSFDAPPPRASSRVSAPSKSVANGDFIAPRAPPAPPPADKSHRRNESVNTMRSLDGRTDVPQSPALRSATLPKHASDGAFTMEEEMARILRGDRNNAQTPTGDSPSVLRRVSNAVKHGRSFSERGVTSTGRSPPHGMGREISSPVAAHGDTAISSPTSTSALEQLRAQLRRANQRIAELEAEKNGLEETVNNSVDIKAASNELKEKRNTMVVLDTQREMIVAELESMTAHLKKAKESNLPLDLTALKTDILKDFTDSLLKVKDHMGSQIEDLMHKRNELTDEIGNLIQMKDKGFQEYESVSSKNAQLVEMNNQLVSQIQDMYKANRLPNGSGGLGIYPGSKAESLANTNISSPDLLRDGEAEPATIIAGPQVVNIRKGQPKKFNWRKGGEKMAKNVTKGLKGAFVGDKPPTRDAQSPYGEIGMPYSATTPQALPGSEINSLNSSRHGQPPLSATAAGFGFFGQKNGGLKPGTLTNMKDTSSTNVSAVVDPSVLFGSELEARCEFEKRVVPSIVTRCVDEVELRGMDVEGIYRKSGGSGQVKSVQQGFEKDGDHDISEEELDIHAVTSALKQYFRKLPTPLITYDVYDSLLEAGQASDKEKQASQMRKAVDSLPEHHRNCLEYLIQHLVRVMSHESINLMTPLNLAVVFAPTIMRPLSIEREMSDMQAQRTAVQLLLEQHEAIFASDD